VGGTVKEGRIELQGDRLNAAEAGLKQLGYKTRRR
jgi:translation initiation factor 1 (eIF-1/SUI1)